MRTTKFRWRKRQHKFYVVAIIDLQNLGQPSTLSFACIFSPHFGKKYASSHCFVSNCTIITCASNAGLLAKW